MQALGNIMDEISKMQMMLDAATLLGGITAIWFLYEKRLTIVSWFKISIGSSINPLSLPDEEFTFIDEKSSNLLNGSYLPVAEKEEYLCKSLVNLKLLKQVGRDKYKLTYIGKKMLSRKNA
jgi:hypothetical protein